MSLLLKMLPIYLFGNLHCIGMCGPLVMMIGHHRFRYYYFAGRLFSFSLAAMLAGSIGAVLATVLQAWHIPAATSFLFGSVILFTALKTLLQIPVPIPHLISKRLIFFHQALSQLMLKDQRWPTFLFGFFTVALPCGQTVIVFSACALSGDSVTGLINGFMFALLTSPSLFFAMQAASWVTSLKKHYNTVVGLCALIVALLAFFRGFAELGLIPHFILNPNADLAYHLVVF